MKFITRRSLRRNRRTEEGEAMKNRKNILIGLLGGAAIGAVLFHKTPQGSLLSSIVRPHSDKVLSARPEFTLAIVGWLLFTLYWEYAARNATEAKRSESRLSRFVHLFLTNM